jgi:hypothetical protein
MTKSSVKTDTPDREPIYRALAYHAALLTHLSQGYDLGGFAVSERADALLDLIRGYAEDDWPVTDESAAASAELLSRISRGCS